MIGEKKTLHAFWSDKQARFGYAVYRNSLSDEKSSAVWLRTRKTLVAVGMTWAILASLLSG
jgi:hypothetical protein